MFSWPRLPSVSLPATIQRRFLSFVLKRSLGHLVKPGQLDPAQIDAQIGSGFVQVNDVQLDDDAINKYLIDLPLPFRLADGSIGKISCRIPWPNLLSAPFALSLSSLCLTFVLAPQIEQGGHIMHATDDLAESVASVAESFINDELSERDNQTLRESFYPKPYSKRHPPGSIDPFLSTEDLDEEHTEIYDHGDEDEGHSESPTHGVSLIATLMERLLARFEFDVSDIIIRFVLPQKTEFTVCLGKLIYRTANTAEDSVLPTEKAKDDGELRTITVFDLSVSLRDLTPPPSPDAKTRRRSASPFTSEEEEEGEMMSQSLASLPPAPSSNMGSPGSSMYQSAVSSAREPSPEPVISAKGNESPEKVILSLGTGAESVVVSLITPPLVMPQVQLESCQGDTNPRPKLQLSSGDKIRLMIAVGPMAVALNPIHARAFYHLFSALAAFRSTNPDSRPPQTPAANPFDFALHVKGITLLLLQSSHSLSPNKIDVLQHFFQNRSAPPSSPRIAHLRIQVGPIEILRNSAPPFTPVSSSGTGTSFPASQSNISASKGNVKASVDEISVFALFSRIHETGESWVASPVLVSDPNLAYQYELGDGRFPTFNVIDWTKGGSTKLSHWRLRPYHAKRTSSGAVSSPSGRPRESRGSVMQVRMDIGASEQSAMCEVDVVPLHIFIDVGIVNGMLRFSNAAAPAFTEERDKHEVIQEGIKDTPPMTPRARGADPWDDDKRLRERRRLETLVTDDFSRNEVPAPSMKIVLRLTLLRVQVRASPPVAINSRPRSGALVVDIHGLQITQQEESVLQQPTASFQPSVDRTGPKVLCMIEFKTLIAATAFPEDTTATTFLSVLPDVPSTHENVPSTDGASPPAHRRARPLGSLPSVCLRSNPILPHRPSTSTCPGVASSFSVEARLPSVHSVISKPTFDGLAFLADDIVQCLFGDSEPVTVSETGERSRDPSLIGSRFFARRTGSTGSSDSGGEGRKSEVVIKVSVPEANILLLIPREGDAGKARPLELTASDVDFLAEIRPEGKDETVVTIGVIDLNAINTTVSGDSVTILALTIPHFLKSSSKSLLKLRFVSSIDSETAAKESRVKVTACGFTYFFTPEYDWIVDLGSFVKTPEGAFESVVPSERIKVAVKVMDGSFHNLAPRNPGALVAYIKELDFSTDLIGDSPETLINLAIPSAHVFLIDDISTSASEVTQPIAHHGAESWKHAGYALLAEVKDFAMRLHHQSHSSVNTQLHIDGSNLTLHACADTLPTVGLFANDFGSLFYSPDEKSPLSREPVVTSRTPHPRHKHDVLASVDENAFRRVPDLGPAPDMIYDDLPTNLDYLDASFGAAAGLREMKDEDFFDFDRDDVPSARNAPTAAPGTDGVISNLGGETIRMLDPNGIRVVEGHFGNIQPEEINFTFSVGETKLNLRLRNCDVTISLYDGYDWVHTRKVIEDEVKAIKRRLAKIRQLLASGQVPDDSIEETSTILFNSVYVGLSQDPDELEPGDLIAAIDHELNEDEEMDTGSETWQSFKRKTPYHIPSTTRVRGKRLARSRTSQIDFCSKGVQAEFDLFNPGESLVSKVLVTVRDLEILDHIKTSTWKTFLTELRTDFGGNVRETASDMVRAELRIVHPVPELLTEEGRLRVKVLPIKLHVDQDALDFMKKFFSFQSPDASTTGASPEKELYFQHVEVFPVDLKLDYKPKRVDYKALREGRTIELMNFFHFDGAEITLRHITLSGITGWPRLFETLNDLWTPDVKSNQLGDIISGVSPIRSLVNVGSGVADLVLLPIAQYKKDKRVVRGVQKGTTSFVKSTAMEAIKLGARLATGTQVILEQAETVLGGQGQFRSTVTTEALQAPVNIHPDGIDEDSEAAEIISKYADQPMDVREGVQTAYRSLAKNFHSAAQTILAVPMEVYERTGNEGPVRAVVRAVPIAVLKPMIGASEAVSKTLFGLRNTMDPEVRHENETKYKQR